MHIPQSCLHPLIIIQTLTYKIKYHTHLDIPTHEFVELNHITQGVNFINRQSVHLQVHSSKTKRENSTLSIISRNPSLTIPLSKPSPFVQVPYGPPQHVNLCDNDIYFQVFFKTTSE